MLHYNNLKEGRLQPLYSLYHTPTGKYSRFITYFIYDSPYSNMKLWGYIGHLQKLNVLMLVRATLSVLKQEMVNINHVLMSVVHKSLYNLVRVLYVVSNTEGLVITPFKE